MHLKILFSLHFASFFTKVLRRRGVRGKDLKSYTLPKYQLFLQLYKPKSNQYHLPSNSDGNNIEIDHSLKYIITNIAAKQIHYTRNKIITISLCCLVWKQVTSVVRKTIFLQRTLSYICNRIHIYWNNLQI